MKVEIAGEFKAFFSWQSDVKGAHSLMGRLLNKAATQVANELAVNVTIDEATRELPGSPDIELAIYKKIDNCDIFIADITPVATQDNGKLLPNSNVMYELGYAVARKGWDKIILLRLKDDSDNKNLPFDINHHRTDVIDVEQGKSLVPHLRRVIEEDLISQAAICKDFFNTERLALNRRSEKYIPDVFVESYASRQYLRLFSDPVTFYSKELKELGNLNFDILNRKQGHEERIKFHERTGIKDSGKFSLHLDQFPESVIDKDFREAQRVFESLRDWLSLNQDGLYHSGNQGWRASSKVRDRNERAGFLAGRLLLATSDAGQGKTNLVCHLVDKVLLKRSIPFIWVNGYELNPEELEESFLKKSFHGKHSSLDDALGHIAPLCVRLHKPLIVIIDGLNEIKYSGVLPLNLLSFINTLINYDFVRVLLTCRENYYNEYFKHVWSLDDLTVRLPLMQRNGMHDNINELLLDGYCRHFNISLSASDEDKDYLTKDKLFLRIFCEVNRDKRISQVNKRKYPLFTAYYDKTLQSLSNRINLITGSNISKYDIKKFFTTLVKMMVEKGKMFNMPLDELREYFEDRHKGLLENFLDENILIKRELEENGECASFTYDEFRDFLIAKYLWSDVFSRDEKKFTDIINSLPGKNPKEGVLPFLFIHARETGNDRMKAMLRSLPEFNVLFVWNIWKLEEDKIGPDDIDLVKSLFASYPLRITHQLLRRWDTDRFNVLNISILLEKIYDMDDVAMTAYIDNVFSSRHSMIPDYNSIPSDDLIDEFQTIVTERRYEQRPELMNVLEFGLILTICDRKMINVGYDLHTILPECDIFKRLSTNSKSSLLQNQLARWI